MLRTTVNIESQSCVKLIWLAKKRNQSVSTCVSHILRDVVSKFNSSSKLSLFRTVKYQKKGLNYRIVHLILDHEVYESCLDLRKFKKVSVSKILNMEIKRIMNEYVDLNTTADILAQKDNYVFTYDVHSKYDPKRREFAIIIRYKET